MYDEDSSLTPQELELSEEISGVRNKVNQLQDQLDDLKSKVSDLTEDQPQSGEMVRNFLIDYLDDYSKQIGEDKFDMAVQRSTGQLRKRVNGLEEGLSQIKDDWQEDLSDQIDQAKHDLFKDLSQLLIDTILETDFEDIPEAKKRKILAQAMYLKGKSKKEIAKELDRTRRQVYRYVKGLEHS